MESSFYNLQNIIVQFATLSFLYALIVGALFLLIRLISQATPSPYTWKAFSGICIPGFFYCFLESMAEHQAWNFLGVLFILLLAGLIKMLLIRKIPMNAYLIAGCSLALVLWLTVPKALMKLF